MAFTRLIILILLVACAVVTACDRRRNSVPTSAPPAPTIKPAADSPRLKAEMTDEEIVRAFGLDPKLAKPELVQGKDGTAATYAAGNQQVTVTRSLVSGVTVMASGRVSGVWPLGKP